MKQIKLKTIATGTVTTLVTIPRGFKVKADMLLADAPTTTSAVTTIQGDVKWGFGTAGIIVAIIGLVLFFMNMDDGPAARRAPIMMMVAGLIMVGAGFAIAAAITPPPGT